MFNHAWKLIACLTFFAACGVAAAQDGSSRPSSSTDEEYVEKVRESSEAARETLEKIVPKKKQPFSRLLDPSKALDALEERDAQIAEAVKRINVSQPARDASDAMNLGRFEDALKLCDESLEAAPKGHIHALSQRALPVGARPVRGSIQGVSAGLEDRAAEQVVGLAR